MKTARVAGGLLAFVLLAACARAPEASPPAASSDAVSRYAAPPAEPAPVTPAPAPAAAPQGLSDDRAEADSAKSDGLEEEFKSLEAAERALNQAKSDLDRLALAQSAPVVGRSRAAGGASEKKEANKGGQPPSASGAGAAPAPNAMCDNTCRAFSSLSRAASAVCRLDSTSAGSHCMRAKKVLAESQQRVASCSCPAFKD